MNFSKIFSFASIALSFLFISYVTYQSEIIFLGDRISYYKIYYAIGILLLLFSFISFYLNRQVKLIITIIFISLVFALYIFEGFLVSGFLNDKSIQEQRIKSAEENGISFDKRSRYEIYAELKKENEDITVVVHPSQFISSTFEIFSLAGISKKKTIHCNENGYFSIYESDRYGFNNPDREWDKDEIEYLLIGDSFVHGACVNEENTISGNLRKRSGEKGVINLGYKGTGTVIQHATLREYGPQLNYKNLLLFYFGNDFEELSYELNNEILNNYFLDESFTQDLINRQKEVDTFLNNFLLQMEASRNNLLSFLKLTSIRKMIIWNFLSNTNESQHDLVNVSKNLKKFKKLITMSKEIADLNESEIYFIYLPMFNRYDSDLNLVDSGQNNYDQVISTVSELNIPIIDIHKELFHLQSDPKKLFPFGIRGHYTAETYSMISDIIIKKVEKYK